MSLVTLQVQFDDGADSSLVAQAFLDDQLNKDVTGEVKSQFAPGDRPFFLVHLDPRLRITQIRCSSGGVRALGQVIRTQRVDNLEVDVVGDTVECERIPEGDLACRWYGNVPSIRRSGRVLTFMGALPATGSATYPYRAWSYQYLPPPLSPTQEWRSRIVVHVGNA